MDDDRNREGDGPSHDPHDGGSHGEIPPGHGGGDSGGGEPQARASSMASGDDGEGPISLRGIFLGNLTMGFRSEEVMDIFNKPIVPRDLPESSYKPMPVDRVDIKRGYCFVFLKDVANMAEKLEVERFVSDINGMAVQNVSSALRAEFARGDGKVKRKEDERRRNISPSETLFVVNFHEETTKKGDLEMLFGPFGELVRIDMKGNYAFVQFRTVEEAMRAKEATNGGKLDRSVLTVEYVANNRRHDRIRREGAGGGGGSYRGGSRDRGRYDDRRGPPRGPPPSRSGGYDRDRGGRDRYDDRGGRGRYDEPRYRDRSPPGSAYRDRSPPGSAYRRRSRSRSYSPPRYRSRSPPRSAGRYDDRDRGSRYDDRRPYDDRGRGPSPDRGDVYRGGDRDRGYRP